MNLSDLLNMQLGDLMPKRRQYGATGEWDPRQPYGATGEWGPVSQNVEDQRNPYPPAGEGGAEGKGLEARGLYPPHAQPAIPVVPAPAPSAFRKEPSQNPIDNPSIPVPSGTGMIRNTRTGAEYLLSGGGSAPSPDLDYTRPIEMFGQGKGYYLKSDPMAAMVNGKRVDLGRDTDKERRLAKEDLVIAKGQQNLREGDASLDEASLKMMAGAMKAVDSFGGSDLSGMVSPAVQGLLSVAAGAKKSRPKPPSGYQWTAEGNLERIPGGPADEKVVNAFHADTLGVQSATSAMDNLLGVANQVLNSPGLEGNYGLKGVLPNVPGGESANAKALLQRLKDVAGFSALNDLKAAGKNGSSGLGAVTEFEHKILQNQLANLDKAQSVAQVKQEIANLVKATEASKQRLTNHYRSVYGKMMDDSTVNPPSPPPIESKATAPTPSDSVGKSSFDTLPDPTGFEGKIIRDSHTGQRFKASGGRWVQQ